MFILLICLFVINVDVWILVLSNNRFNESIELIIILFFLLYFLLLILYILLYFVIILLYFLLYFLIRIFGGVKKKMENLKFYYFRIFLELVFLKGVKMVVELCKSWLYFIVF